MANSNKVFVSPGVYTSEKDLTFVAQSVGVTTLGMAGETLKGPAFEPILITNFGINYSTANAIANTVGDGNANLTPVISGLGIKEGVWRWVTGEPYSYSSWNAGEPNNAGNEDEL